MTRDEWISKSVLSTIIICSISWFAFLFNTIGVIIHSPKMEFVTKIIMVAMCGCAGINMAIDLFMRKKLRR